MKLNRLLVISILTLLVSYPVNAQYAAWTGSGVINIITTPDGADLPGTASEDNFPLLVRLSSAFFDFSQVRAGGADIRFSSGTTPLKYQIEEWDAAGGKAGIWVLIPNIAGNAVQPINIHWGNSSATSESDGAAVFNGTTGFVSVMHMQDPTVDAVGVLNPVNHGTTQSDGLVGKSRNFETGDYINCGSNITTFPTGSNPHSTSAWIKVDVSSGNVLGWGKFNVRGMVVMQLASPAHIKMEGYFSNGQVEGTHSFAMGQWVHVMHTYVSGDARIYVNGVLDNTTTSGEGMDFVTPTTFSIGGFAEWQDYSFAGDIDEVHISNVTRSQDWVKLEYQNQKPLQSLTGWIVPSGSDFSVSQASVTVAEGGSVNLTAAAGGALKTTWTLIDVATQTVIASNTLSVDLPGYRVAGNKQFVLRFSGVYPTEVKTRDIAVTVTEALPDPVFTLTAPATWNGRDPIDVTAQVTNMAAMQAAGVGSPTYDWTVSNVAVIKEITTGKLTLNRSQGSGTMIVTLTMENGGATVGQSVLINVQEPTTDAWVERTPGAGEKPVSGQFYARPTGGKCTIHYNGTQAGAGNVYLKAMDGSTEVDKTTEATAGGVYTLSVEVDAKLTNYSVEFGTADGAESPVATVNNLMCGDAYMVQGQSNAEATAWGNDPNPANSPWVKTWGSMGTTPGSGFQTAVHRVQSGEQVGQVGYWALELAKRIVTAYNIPIFIINGAKGGTRVDEHQKNEADPNDEETIYGRLLTRIQGARLTHGIRGVLWHQGENDQGSEAPTGQMNYVTYQYFFNEMAADWKTDFPNIQNYYIYQIWPYACGGKREGSESKLREKQRSLPDFYSNMGIMSTLGIRPGSGCHYVPAGYDEFARLIFPLVERDNYGKVFTTSITPPNIIKTYYSTAGKNQIALVFDQPVAWDNNLNSEFYLDGESGKVTSGSVSGNILTLNLNAASTATTITYLDSRNWSEDNILWGTNDIAALTFWEVPIYPDENYIPASVEEEKPGPITGINARLQNGTLHINLGQQNNNPVTVQLYNLNGKPVFQKQFLPWGVNVELAVPDLNRGIYILRVMQNGGTAFTKKITGF